MSDQKDLAGRKAQLSDARRALLQKRLAGKQTKEQIETSILPQPLDGPLPLSFTQQRLWFLNQIFPNNRAYNMSMAYRLRGPLDTNALQQALYEICRRHAALRTQFLTLDNEAVQHVVPQIDCPLVVTDLTHLPAAEREQLIPERVTAEANHLFDLDQAPLLRPSLIRLDEEEYVFQLVLQHIITDEWSNDIIWRDLSRFYSSALAGEPLPAARPGIQYTDFARWQREQVASGKLDQQMEYWREQLGGELPLLQLPSDRPRPSVQRLQGGMVRRTLPAELLANLKSLSAAAGASLYMTLLAAYFALLHRLSGQEDILVGTPIANRQRPETKEVVGMFVNTGAIRAALDGEMSFEQLLAQVRLRALDALANQDLPFDLLVKALQPERNLSHNPIFQSMFVLLTESAARTLPGLFVERINIDPGVSKFDLTFFAGESEGALYSAVEYNRDLFEHATAQRLLDHWQTLLQAIIANPAQPLRRLTLLNEAERDLLLKVWNQTTLPLPKKDCLHQQFAAIARENPQALAVVDRDERLTYGELNGRANQLAHRLLDEGIAPGTPVGLFVERSVGMIIGILGILKAGGAYVPLDPNYPARRTSLIIDDLNLSTIVSHAALADWLQPARAKIMLLNEDLGPLSPNDPQVALAPSDLAYIIYTSGSTGTPKGVMISHDNLLNSTFARQSYYEQPVGRYLLLSSFAFDSSVAGIFWTLSSGGALILPAQNEEKEIDQLAALIAREKITHTLALPSLYHLLLTYAPREQLRSLQTVIAAGEACSPELAELHHDLLPETALYNEYGPTEATIWSTVYQIKDQEEGTVPIGAPIANSQAYILDAQQQPLPIGIPGELYIGGAGLAQGYWNNVPLTADRFPHISLPGSSDTVRLYRTGDLARWQADGQIQFLGRIDEQLNIRGYRVEPEEIEAVLKADPSLQDAVVLAVDAAGLGNGDQNRTIADEDLLQALQQLDPTTADLLLSEVENSAVPEGDQS